MSSNGINGKRIANKSALYFVGNLTSKFLSFLLLPIYAYYVTTEDLGSYDYFITILNIVMPLLLLCLWEAVIRYLLKDDGELSKSTLISSTVAYILAVAVIIVLGTTICWLVLDSTNYLLYGLTLLFSCLKQMWQFFARACSENKIYVISSIYGSIAFILANIVCLMLFDMGLSGLLIAFSLSQLIIFLLIEYKIHIIKQVSINEIQIVTLKAMLTFSTPLVINHISVWLLNGASRLILKNTLGSSANGIYSYANRFAVLITMLSAVFSMALIEEAYLQNDDSDYANNFSIIISKLFRLYFSIIIVAVPVIQIIFEFMKTSDYYASADYVYILMLAAMFAALANSFGTAFQVKDKTKYIFITTLIGGVVTVGLSLALYKILGILGVTVAYMLGTMSQMISRAIYAKKITGLSIHWLPVITLFALSILEGILMQVSNNLVLSIVFVIAVVFAFVYNKEDIIKVFHYIKTMIQRKVK